MGGSSRPPPPPDYTPIANAQTQAAQMAYDMQAQQLAWAQEQFAANQAVTQSFIDDAMARQDVLDAQAAADRARYEQIFQPLEDELVADAKRYSSEAFQEAEAGKAAADISNQFNLARAAAQDRLESFGIDPSQTRAAALDVQSRVAEAATRAGAANVARDATEARGMALRDQALAIGRGYPGQVLSQYGAGLASGGAGVNAGINLTQSGASTMGTAPQWAGIGAQALGGWADTINRGYQNSLDAYRARQNQSSGWGTTLGLIGGVGLNIATGGTAAGFRNLIPSFEEGGAVGDTPAVPKRHSGVPIMPAMSPSRGVNVDDVALRANVGEFIVPTDVTKWKGEEFFQKLIVKSREDKGQATAKPRVVPPPNHALQASGHAGLPV